MRYGDKINVTMSGVTINARVMSVDRSGMVRFKQVDVLNPFEGFIKKDAVRKGHVEIVPEKPKTVELDKLVHPATGRLYSDIGIY